MIQINTKYIIKLFPKPDNRFIAAYYGIMTFCLGKQESSEAVFSTGYGTCLTGMSNGSDRKWMTVVWASMLE